MKEQETPTTWHGVIDSRPMAMAEDPEHITFRMRSSEGTFLEVFAPRELVQELPGVFGQGQPITITGESVLAGETPQTPILVFAQKAKSG